MPGRKILQSIKWFFYILIVGTPIFYWKWSLSPYAIPKTAFFEAVVELIFFLWLALAVSDKRYRPKITPLAWAIMAYLAVLTITAFTGVDAWRSFFSDTQRAFGIVAYYHLAALALVMASLFAEIPWKKLWYVSFATSLLPVGIAIIQLKLPDLLLSGDSAGGRPGATFGNPTFLAGYLLFNIFLAGYYLFFRDAKHEGPTKSRGEVLFLLATVIGGIVGVFITETRGDIFGLFAGIFALIFLFAFRPPIAAMPLDKKTPPKRFAPKRSFYVLILVVLILGASGVWLTRNNALWDRVPGIDRLKDLTISGANSDIGPRIIAADAAWKGFLQKPFTGWGFENFNIVFNTYYNPKVLEYGYAESNFDKPHDIFLEMMDAGGVLLLIAYLAIFAVALYESFKLKDRLMSQLAAAAIVAYLVRSAVIFDTIGPAMMLYVLLGFVDGHYQQERAAIPEASRKPIQQGQRNGVIKPAVGITALVAAIVTIYILNGTALAASYDSWEGHEDIQLASNPAGGIAAFEAGAATWNVYQWDFTRDYANTVAQAYFYDASSIPQAAVVTAVNAMQAVTAAHPNDAYNHYLLTDIYNLAYDINPQQYLPEAEAQAQIALQLSPNRQEIYYYLAKTKSLEGDNADALALAKQALDLDPNVPDSHYYYGMLAFANGENDIGYSEVETAIAMGRQWQNFDEPAVAADYFADSGHLPQAIQLYQAALALNPTDIDVEAKLGAAYYLSGNDVLAKQYLTDVASKFNFSQSPSYSEYGPILNALGISN